MSSCTVRDAHQSGRFDADTAHRATMLGGIAKHATVGVVTEAVGLDMLDGWLCVGGETKIVWNDAKWEHLDDGSESIPTTPWKRGASHREAVEIEWASLANRRTDVTLLRLGGHLPAHLYRSAQRIANEAALDGLAQIIHDLAAEHSPDIITLSMDFNRDLRLNKQRVIVREALKGTGLEVVVPPKATHGLVRIIDGAATSGDQASAEMLAKVGQFDHRGFSVAACACPQGEA